MTEATIHSNIHNRVRPFRVIPYIILFVIAMSGTSCYKQSLEGSILVIQGNSGQDSGNELAVFHPDHPERNPIVLVDGFHEMEAPAISFEGDAVLFQAKKNAVDFWQIWEYHMESEELQQVTEAESDCIDPVYLPDGRIVYCRFESDYSGYHVLETCHTDGSEVQQITFSPIDFRSPTILGDGRILAFAREMHPKPKKSQLMVMRPDGTKIELFYEPEEHKKLLEEAGSFEAKDGKIVFREVNSHNLEKEWVSVDYTQPLNSRATVDFDNETPFNQVICISQPRPKKLPSEVNPESETALLVCMDANLTEGYNLETTRKSVKIELLGLQGSMGTVGLEKDGSVYLKVQANMPFRMQTLDDEGEVVQGPSSWLQLRPNERRGCVGCHAGHTRVPENRQPLAVQKEPVEIPLYRETIMASRMTKKIHDE